MNYLGDDNVRLVAGPGPHGLAWEELTREQDAIIDSLAEGLWITDRQGRVLRINPASERLNQVKAAQVVGRTVQELMAEGIFDRSATLEVLRQKTTISMLQNCRGRKLVLTGIPVLDDAGAIIRVVVTEQDITEIDALHQELEEKEAMRERLRDHLVELQVEEAESSRFIARSPCMQKALRHAVNRARFSLLDGLHPLVNEPTPPASE